MSAATTTTVNQQRGGIHPIDKKQAEATEAVFARELAGAVMAWKEAGRPRKR